jgi:hypothetical protein
MNLKLRPPRPEDAPGLGRICYEAFKAIADEHNFPPDFPNVAGSNFVDERDSIAGIGPITVDPAAQNHSIGRQLMLDVMRHAERRGSAGIRLVQAGYHCRSLSLYTKLGFDPREHLSCMQGPAIREAMPGYAVRAATEADVEACNRLCIRVHGHHRGGELRAAVRRGIATVVERAGRISGYATQVAFPGHAVAESNDDLMALICKAEAFPGPGFLVPSRNGELMRWCFAKGLRMTQSMTLMTIGLYNEPAGSYLPSILY